MWFLPYFLPISDCHLDGSNPTDLVPCINFGTIFIGMLKHLFGISSPLPFPLFFLVPSSPSLPSPFVLSYLSLCSPHPTFYNPTHPLITLQFMLFWAFYSTPLSTSSNLSTLDIGGGLGILVETSHPNCSTGWKYFLSKAQSQASLKFQLGKKYSIQRVLKASIPLFVVNFISFH